jgi:molybdopterin-guanine dinucleotide biosynthesis protein A
MREGLTGIVLAGGLSRRFGSNKALSPWAGGCLVQGAVRALRSVAGNVLVVVKDPDGFQFLEEPGVHVKRDDWADHHALGGLYTGLTTCATEHAFVCAADMPLIRPALVEILYESRGAYEAVVPRWQGRLQPLCAVYAKTGLPALARQIADKEFSLHAALDRLRVCFIEDPDIQRVDPMGLSFMDADTPEDLERIAALGRSPVGESSIRPA